MTNFSAAYAAGSGQLPFTELSPTDYAAGLWYAQQMGPIATMVNNSGALLNGTMALVPFIPRFTHTFTGIGWFHSAAGEGSNHIRLGIYASTAGKPSGSPLVDSGSIATTASIEFCTAVISQMLTKGQLYWLAANADASLTGNTWAIGSAPEAPWFVHGLINPATTLATATGATGRILGFTQTAAFGALPAIGTLVDNALNTMNPPNIFLKG